MRHYRVDPSFLPLPRAKRVGLLGGSFNPAHDGHFHITQEALTRLRLKEVWWLVSPQNPLKPTEGMAGFEDRLAAAQCFAETDRRIRISGIEAAMQTRATIDTLAGLGRRFPRTEFIWLMGSDNLIQFPQWRCWHQIFQHCRIAVFTRPTYDLRGLCGKAATRFARSRIPQHAAARLSNFGPPAWVFLNFRRQSTSATAIRDQRKSKGSL